MVPKKNLTCTQRILFSSLRKTFGFLYPTGAGLSLSPEDHCLSGSPQVEDQRKLGKYKRIVPTLRKKKKSENHGIWEWQRILETSSLTPHFINRYKENEVFSKMNYWSKGTDLFTGEARREPRSSDFKFKSPFSVKASLSFLPAINKPGNY